MMFVMYDVCHVCWCYVCRVSCTLVLCMQSVMYKCHIQALDAQCRYAECLDAGQMSVGLMVFGQKRCYPESLFQVIIAARASQLPANNISNPFFKKKTFFFYL
jgi:hypothetical protein